MELYKCLSNRQIEILDELIDNIYLFISPESIHTGLPYLNKTAFLKGILPNDDILKVLDTLEETGIVKKPANSDDYPIEIYEGSTQIELQIHSSIFYTHEAYVNVKSIKTNLIDTETIKRYANIIKLTQFSPFKKDEIHKILSITDKSELGADTFTQFMENFESDLLELKKYNIIDFELLNDVIFIHFNLLILFRFGVGISNQLMKRTKSNKAERTIVHEITWTKDRRILLDGEYEIGKPNFMQENDLVFDFLYNNPNKPWTKDDIKSYSKVTIGKSFDKIVENLGFKGDLRKVFFNISKTHIQFNNPVTNADMLELGIQKLHY